MTPKRTHRTAAAVCGILAALLAAVPLAAAATHPPLEAAWQAPEGRDDASLGSGGTRGTCTGTPVTQSIDPNVIGANSVWCGSPDTNAETSLARSFVFAEDGTIGCVRFAITENWDPPWNVYVRVLQGSIGGPYGNLTLLAETPVDIPTGVAQEFFDADMVAIPVTAGVEYVIELRVPSRFPADGGDGGLLALGCNSLGETAPTYIRAPACGAPDFLPLSSIGFGNRHLVMTLMMRPEGTSGTILCPDGTPLANCTVNLEYFNKSGVIGATSTTTDSNWNFLTYYSGCVPGSSFPPHVGFRVTTPCCPSQVWTVYSGSCSGNAGTLICNNCSPPQGQGLVYGIKFRDDNCDGVQQSSEPGLPGWQVIVTNQATGEQYTSTTNASGVFMVSPVPYGTYIVTEIPQPGFRAPCKAGRSVVNAANEWGDAVELANCPCPLTPYGEDIHCGSAWNVVSTPAGVPGSLPRPVNIVAPHAAWDPAVCWMSATPSGSSSSLPGGQYVYEYCFCLSEHFSNPFLDLCVKADDAVAVYLNGVHIGNGVSHNAWGTCGQVTTTDPFLFRPGQNCIRLVVNNAFGPTGVSVFGLALATDGWCCPNPCPCVYPPAYMTGWWMLDETSGTNAHDSAHFWNDGTHTNGPAVGVGIVNAARTYDGVDDYTEVPNHADLNFGTGAFSIDAWVRTNAANGVIVSKRYSNFASALDVRGYVLKLAGGQLQFELATGPTVWDQEWFSFVGAPLNDGRWHHVAATIKRGDPFGAKLYVDGVPQTFGTAIGGSLSNSSVLRIGSRTDAPSVGPGEYFNGVIDEVELFKVALNPDQVYRLWRAGPSGKCRINPAPCPADMNCDGLISFDDIDPFVAALGYPGGDGWPYPDCPWLGADCNNDGAVDFDDIDAFVALIGTVCP